MRAPTGRARRARRGRALAALALLLSVSCTTLRGAPRDDAGELLPTVRDIEWVGVSAVPEADLEGAILTTEANWRPWIEDEPFRESTLEQDEERVESYYARRGHYEARASASVRPAGEGRVRVRFTVEEGPPVLLGALSTRLAGAAAPERPIEPEALFADLALEPGEVFDLARYRDSKAAILSRLAARGYPAARIEGGAQVRIERHDAEVQWRVFPGPFVRLGETTVEGTTRLEPELVEREIRIEPGAPYDPAVLQRQQRRLFDLGVFRSVTVEAVPPEPEPEAGTPGQDGPGAAAGTEAEAEADEPARGAGDEPEGPEPVAGAEPEGDEPVAGAEPEGDEPVAGAEPEGDEPAAGPEAPEAAPPEGRPEPVAPAPQVWPVRVRVDERKPRSIRVGVGYGSDEGPRVQGEWVHRNFLGGLRRLRFLGRYSGLERGFETVLRQPHFLARDLTLSLDAELAQDDTPAYESEGVGAGWRLERPLFEEVIGRFGQRYDLRRVTDVDAPDLRDTNEGERFQLVYFELGLRRSTLDQPIDPTRGTWLDLQVEPSFEAMGSELDYVRSVVEGRGYLPLPIPVPAVNLGAWKTGVWQTVIATRARLGTLEPLGGERNAEVPIFERFFAGGTNSVRGFRLWELGPLDEGDDPVGGLTVAEGNLELRFPIWGELGAVAFVDAGQVALTPFTLRSEDFFYSAGGGLRLGTPIGPIRVDVGRILNPPEGIPVYQVHFSVGQAF